MESASPKRQSLQAAGKLPEALSASNGMGISRGAMMIDQSLRKAGWVNTLTGLSGRHRKRAAFDFFVHRNHRAIRFAIVQGGIADARQLVSQRTGRLVEVGTALHRQSPSAQAIELLAGGLRHAGRAQYRA
jgi:hypothetical protein